LYKKGKVGLKTSKYHIICSRILLICFIAGQYMVFAHQHNISQGITKVYGISKNIQQQTVKEKCYLCDVMHHNSMVTASNVYFNAVTVAGHVFKSAEYGFTSIQLILSGGRAPPPSNYRS
jgi:PP-loop superfamily ATP-utilizing enzyme